LALTQSTTQGGREVIQALEAWARRHYRSALKAASRTQSAISDAPHQWGLLGALTIVLLIIVVNARRLWGMVKKLRVACHPEKSPRTGATLWYERMTRLIALRGWRKLPMQTPGEFLVCIEDIEMRMRVKEFTQYYESARFGDSAEDARKLPGLYEEIAGSKPK
jgi:hypothetical protein